MTLVAVSTALGAAVWRRRTASAATMLSKSLPESVRCTGLAAPLAAPVGATAVSAGSRGRGAHRHAPGLVANADQVPVPAVARQATITL